MQLGRYTNNDVRIKLSRLNSSQLKVFTLIALGFSSPLTGKVAQNRLDLTSPSIAKAIKSLEEEDFIIREANNRFSIVDPLYKSVLFYYERENVG